MDKDLLRREIYGDNVETYNCDKIIEKFNYENFECHDSIVKEKMSPNAHTSDGGELSADNCFISVKEEQQFDNFTDLKVMQQTVTSFDLSNNHELVKNETLPLALKCEDSSLDQQSKQPRSELCEFGNIDCLQIRPSINTYKNGSILNIPTLKSTFPVLDRVRNDPVHVLHKSLNPISKNVDFGSVNYQDQIDNKQVQGEQREISSEPNNYIGTNQFQNNINGNTVKKSTSRRKGNIPKRKGKQKEMNSDEKLVEKEVKKYLLKIPSLKANYAALLSKPSVSSCPGILNSSYRTIDENDQNRLPGDRSLPDQTITDKNGLHRIANNDESFSHMGLYEHVNISIGYQNNDILNSQSENSANNSLNETVINVNQEDPMISESGDKLKKCKSKEKVFCGLCNKSFGRPSELRRHSVLHTGEKPHSCDECKKLFTQRYHLIRHVKTVHKKEIENLVCGVCNETFNSEYLLMRHVKRHGIMTFACELCKKEFKTKRQMKEHVLSLHVGVKPFKCEQCDKVFARKYHLERHVMIHTGTRDFQCEYCGKEFCTKGNLLAHVRRVHLKIREFTCGVCQKGFFSPKDLQTHLKKHTGEKPYQCDVCMKRFSEKINMEWHLRIHSGERPYQCPNCEKSYTRMPHLIRHQREGICARRIKLDNIGRGPKHDEVIRKEVIGNTMWNSFYKWQNKTKNRKTVIASSSSHPENEEDSNVDISDDEKVPKRADGCNTNFPSQDIELSYTNTTNLPQSSKIDRKTINENIIEENEEDETIKLNQNDITNNSDSHVSSNEECDFHQHLLGTAVNEDLNETLLI